MTDRKQDSQEFYVGDATMRHVFIPAGLVNLADMQAVLDQVEVALQTLEGLIEREGGE